MSKELTEQWRNGTLPENWYYIHLKSNWGGIDCITINYCDEDGVFEEYPDEDIKEVIAPVPSYKEFFEDKKIMKGLGRDYSELMNQKVELLEKIEQLVQKMHILEKKLDIAVKALNRIREVSAYNPGQLSYIGQFASRKVKTAIKEIDLVGTSVSLVNNKM